MKTAKILSLEAFIFLCLACVPPSVPATTIDVYPNPSVPYADWPTDGEWTAIPSLNDPDDGVVEQLDFVGDATNPGGFIAWDDNYLYFRQRVDIGTVTTSTFRDSTWVLIDLIGFKYNPAQPDNTPDYALVWDSKSNDITAHGLEFQIYKEATSSWSTVRMDDIDLSASQKIAPPDINMSTDGYLRTVDSQSTTNFGTTSFIDYAVSWAYLAANSELEKGTQTWKIQFGSRVAATDHNYITTDVAGNSNPTDLGFVWSDALYPGGGGGGDVPEPSTLLLLLPVLGFGLRKMRAKKH